MPSYIDVDIVKVRLAPEPRAEVLTTLFWGDEVRGATRRGDYTRVRLDQGRVGYVRGPLALRKERLLHVAYIDVGQGDAALIETPEGYRVLIDAGEGKFMARYIAMKYAGHPGPVHFDAIIITHGDADHFLGLPILVDAANDARKRVVVTASRVFHNGLAKRQPSSGQALLDSFGRTVQGPDGPLITDLVDEPGQVPRAQRTPSYQRWVETVDTLRQRAGRRAGFLVQRLDASNARALSFLGPSLQAEVLGPVLQRLGRKAGLPFLKGDMGRGWSVSHTINGHSIVLRLVHGDVRFLFSGDLNQESEELLLRMPGMAARLRAEVFKVPHHGSADFEDAFLRTVNPIVSVVSTGATDARRDYLHPRATLLAALGAAARTPVGPSAAGVRRGPRAEPIIFVTKMAGALRYMGRAVQVHEKKGRWLPKDAALPFYALERSNYGIVHVRSDGKRFLVVRRGSGLEKQEAYAYRSTGQSEFVAESVSRL